MRLTPRRLNRTLLQRQHLLARVPGSVDELTRHLVGLQAQENLPPFLSLAARLTDLDPHEVTRGLEARTLVRLLTLRGTVHLHVADDALALGSFTRPAREREVRASPTIGTAREVDRAAFAAELSAVLSEGPLPLRRLGEALAERFPEHTPGQLGQLARATAPLVQLPPRGTWQGSGGVVYQYVHRWLGRPEVDADVEDVVRRYLRAFGPASAADVTTWSGVTRLGPVVRAMDDLVRHQDDSGRVLIDVPEAEPADEDVPAPVRLLGRYDNLWLSHAGRDRVTEPGKRRAWMGVNGAEAAAVLVDGCLEGLWRVVDGRVRVLELFRSLSRGERSGLDEEVERVESLLRR